MKKNQTADKRSHSLPKLCPTLVSGPFDVRRSLVAAVKVAVKGTTPRVAGGRGPAVAGLAASNLVVVAFAGLVALGVVASPAVTVAVAAARRRSHVGRDLGTANSTRRTGAFRHDRMTPCFAFFCREWRVRDFFPDFFFFARAFFFVVVFYPTEYPIQGNRGVWAPLMGKKAKKAKAKAKVKGKGKGKHRQGAGVDSGGKRDGNTLQSNACINNFFNNEFSQPRSASGSNTRGSTVPTL